MRASVVLRMRRAAGFSASTISGGTCAGISSGTTGVPGAGGRKAAGWLHVSGRAHSDKTNAPMIRKSLGMSKLQTCTSFFFDAVDSGNDEFAEVDEKFDGAVADVNVKGTWAIWQKRRRPTA